MMRTFITAVPLPTQHAPRRQRGFVLVIALIFLVIISMVAAISMRNATSSEGVSANVRQTQLASQAAETALRYCETALLNLLSASPVVLDFSIPPNTSTYVALAATHLQDLSSTPASMTASNWDMAQPAVPILILPTTSVNRIGISTTFSRPPECMIERLSPLGSSAYDRNFNITARGFGPEVAPADNSRSRPIGSEVWMQSSLELN